VQPKKPHVPAQKPSGVITPEDRAQWSIFGESLPLAPQAENNPPPLQVKMIQTLIDIYQVNCYQVNCRICNYLISSRLSEYNQLSLLESPHTVNISLFFKM
jgi:hypothetical protein